jgi:F420-non-reducing hydrogenase iron-sulfur subunit
MKPDFTLKIIVFACNWCSYGGADLAGVGRLQYPASSGTRRMIQAGGTGFQPVYWE